ncbi:integral peroxisomal membrane peroxin-domain-containing protein [Vararia minispora EC-137]|uniref:Integral peroxisomal membrane peroxin-domain-containing protein n=1 Tax=Vararia minispora EC-137 TaxID=1314806 RepID=A0ACB8QU31_9AGAM|nr:integral peroxisomal membrane peroxin-domain-containing protein [Vararia minispora EC-137]
MAVPAYVQVPPYAALLPDEPEVTLQYSNKAPPAAAVASSLPPPIQVSEECPSSPSQASPGKSALGNLPGLLLASTLQIPNTAVPNNPRGSVALLSTRDPLSVPITTVNFRRFISKIGPVFWLQDRIEEILLWRKGWKFTATWMAIYAFVCYYPRLILLLPNAIIISVLVATHPSPHSAESNDPEILPPPRANAREGSSEWFANIQGIQNLMGAFADLYDAVFPYIPHLTHSTPYTLHILTFTCILTAVSLFILPFIPLRAVFLVLGLAPFMLTHPWTLHNLPALIHSLPLRRMCVRIARVIDDDRLQDTVWQSPLREVELYENERLSGELWTWSKTHLKPGERVAWTRGRDGWSALAGGDVRNLTFELDRGWAFVETEDWRADVEGLWSSVGSDESVYCYVHVSEDFELF